MKNIDIELFLIQLKIVRDFLSGEGYPAMSATINRAILLIRELIIKSNIH